MRAAELFFRPQRMTLHEGSLLAADREHIAKVGEFAPRRDARAKYRGPFSRRYLINCRHRSDRFDFALDLTARRRGIDALAYVIARWIMHLLLIEVDVKPLTEFHSVAFSWYVGLDADGTKIGDALWRDRSIDETTAGRVVVGLFRLTLADAGAVIERMMDEPVSLILAMTPDGELRLKPQNLVTGLPLRAPEVA